MSLLSLHEIKQGISHLFYPQLCEGCNKPLVATEKVLCLSCGMELPETGTYLGTRFGESLQGTDWVGTVDMIVPVPLHPSKLAARGYNQSMVIAEAMGKVLKIAASDDLLARTRETESQTHKSREERAANMAGAFMVPSFEQIVGKHILIVDDVLTTGGTIEACSIALLAQKNVKISVATIGIAIS